MEKDGILLAIPRSLQRSSAKGFPTAKAERFRQPSQFHLWQVNSSSGLHHWCLWIQKKKLLYFLFEPS